MGYESGHWRDCFASRRLRRDGQACEVHRAKGEEASWAGPGRFPAATPIPAMAPPKLPMTCGEVVVHALGKVSVRVLSLLPRSRNSMLRKRYGILRTRLRIRMRRGAFLTDPVAHVLHSGTLVQVEPQKAGYHDQDFIYPVGYKSSRKYLSVVDPATKCTYYSEVVGGPKDEPVFRVTCEHDSTEPIEEKTADVRIPPSPPCVARSSDWRDTWGSRRCLGAGSAGRALCPACSALGPAYDPAAVHISCCGRSCAAGSTHACAVVPPHPFAAPLSAQPGPMARLGAFGGRHSPLQHPPALLPLLTRPAGRRRPCGA